MMISVIAYFVSLGSLAVDEIGIIFCVFADDEKRRSDGVFRKKIKYFRGFLGCGPSSNVMAMRFPQPSAPEYITLPEA